MELVRRRRLRSSVRAWRRQLEVRERLGVEQLAELLLAEQLAQEVAVEGQRAGPALGQRRVAVVHVRGHVVEQERARERATRAGVSTLWTAISRRAMPPRTSRRAGRSKTSDRTSR